MRGTVAILTLTLSLCLCFASNQSQAAPGPAIDSAIPQPDSSETVTRAPKALGPNIRFEPMHNRLLRWNPPRGVRPILAQNGA